MTHDFFSWYRLLFGVAFVFQRPKSIEVLSQNPKESIRCFIINTFFNQTQNEKLPNTGGRGRDFKELKHFD